MLNQAKLDGYHNYNHMKGYHSLIGIPKESKKDVHLMHRATAAAALCVYLRLF